MWCIQHSQGPWKEHIYVKKTGTKDNWTYTYPKNYRENLKKGKDNKKTEEKKEDEDEWDEHTYTDKNGQIQSYLVKKGATEEERKKAEELAMKEQEEKEKSSKSEEKTTKKKSSSSGSSGGSSKKSSSGSSGSSGGSSKKSSSGSSGSSGGSSKKSSSGSSGSSKKSSSSSKKKSTDEDDTETVDDDSTKKKKSGTYTSVFGSSSSKSNDDSKVEYKSGADGATGLKSVKTQDQYDTHTYVDTNGQIQEYVVRKGASEAERRYAQEQAEKERKKKEVQHSSMWIAHHGILGQKWGIQNGPPYPLSSGSHNASERKAGWKKSLNGKNPSLYGSSDSSKKNKDKKEVDRSGNTNELKMLAAKIALDAVSLNPIGLVSDVRRIAEAAGANARKNRLEKRWKTEEIDKSTGFHKKNKNFTAEQDMEAVNPEFRNFNTDTKKNCMLCTSTYELRRRGYDVTANKVGRGYTRDIVKEWFPGAQIKEVSGSGKVANTFMGDKKFADNMISELKKQPVGARGNVMINWSAFGDGHSMVYEVTNSGVIIRDCQTNKTYRNPEKILKRAVSGSYARLDNVEFDKKKIKEVCR